MQISIHADDLLFNIQHRFQELYPYLKLEFLLPHKAQEKLNRAPAAMPLKSVGFTAEKKTINVHPERPVAHLEEELKEMVGVNVQVLRKCGPSKHEPVPAPHATLAHQNKQGRLRTAFAKVSDVY